ncbi:hypothetical protein Tco_1188664, partial [Tanacetum coccineum]
LGAVDGADGTERGYQGRLFHMAQQIVPADQLVSKFQSIRRCNNYDVLQSIPCSPECNIVGQILLDHPLCYALTATADVPAVYLQQFWKIVGKVPKTKDTIKFKLDTQDIVYTVDMFRATFKLPVETPDNPCVAVTPPKCDTQRNTTIRCYFIIHAHESQ